MHPLARGRIAECRSVWYRRAAVLMVWLAGVAPAMAQGTPSPAVAAATSATSATSEAVTLPVLPAPTNTSATTTAAPTAADTGSPTPPIPGPTAAAPVTPPPPKPVPAITLAFDIDLTRQQMTVKEYGKVVGSWPISSGRAGYRTPRGAFRPRWQARMWYSRQYDSSPMPHSVFFNGGIAMHATQEVHRLGRPASHGCIRQSPANAARSYALVSKHGYDRTRIVVRGSPPAGEPTLARAPRDRGDDRASGRPPARRMVIVSADGTRRIGTVTGDQRRWPRPDPYGARGRYPEAYGSWSQGDVGRRSGGYGYGYGYRGYGYGRDFDDD